MKKRLLGGFSAFLYLPSSGILEFCPFLKHRPVIFRDFVGRNSNYRFVYAYILKEHSITTLFRNHGEVSWGLLSVGRRTGI